MSLVGLGPAISNWPNRIAEHLLQEAAVARSIPDRASTPYGKAHIASLAALIEKLRGGVSSDDPRSALYAALFTLLYGGPNPRQYTPSPLARKTISGQGTSVDKLGTADPHDFLLELAAAEIYDFAKKHQAALNKVTEAEQTAEAAVAATDGLKAERDRLADELRTVKAERKAAIVERDSERGKVAHLVGRLAAVEGEESEAVGAEAVEPAKRRRRKSFGEANIYITDRADGSVHYEVKLPDEGWRTFETLAEARRYRDLKLEGRAAVEDTVGVFELASGFEIEWQDGDQTHRKELPADTTPEQAIELRLALIEQEGAVA